MSALAGLRVVVTRAREQADPLCAALEARGAEAVGFPTIEIRPVEDPAVDRALDALRTFDWIAFTSANAVRFFWPRLHAAGHPALPPSIRIAAVGAATAGALAERGARAEAVPEAFSGVRLAAALEREGSLLGRRVLLPRSEIGREETAEALRAAGALVTDVIVYRTVTVHPEPAALLALESPVDAVTFTSPSTVRGFLEAGGAAAARVLDRAVIACIGPTTAAAVRAEGWSVNVQPARHTAPALVDALEVHFGALREAGRRSPR